MRISETGSMFPAPKKSSRNRQCCALIQTVQMHQNDLSVLCSISGQSILVLVDKQV